MPKSKRQERRERSLLPDGIPRYVRCYDKPETGDRFTVLFTKKRVAGEFMYLGMSADPYHPQGIGQHGAADWPIDTGVHGFPPKMGQKTNLGTRIRFQDLPPKCQRLVLSDYRELWGLPAMSKVKLTV